MEYRVLGSLEVLDRSGHRLPLGDTRQQTVLASILLPAGWAVHVERPVELPGLRSIAGGSSS